MTTIDTSSPSDLLTLQACPQCEYSLAGLPTEGTCPECGREYDRSLVIVRCHPIAMSGLNPVLLGGIALVTAVGVAAMCITSDMLQKSPQLVVVLAFVAAMAGLTCIDRIASPRKGDWLLWVTPSGIGTQTEFDPDSLIARARHWVPLLWWPIYMFAGFVPITFRASGWVPLVVMLAGMALVALMVVAMRKKIGPIIPASGVQPRLFPWGSCDRIAVTQKYPGTYRILISRNTWVNKYRIVDTTFDSSPELVEQLTKRINELSGQYVQR